MRKRKTEGIKKMLAAGTACILLAGVFFLSEPSLAQENALPDRTGYGALKWGVKVGTDWQDAPTPPAVEGNNLYVASGKRLIRMDKRTGEKTGECALSEAMSYGICPPVFDEGDIFAGIDGGRVEAVDAETMEKKWVSDRIGDDEYAQVMTPVTVSGSYVFASTCSFGNDGGTYGSFACLDRRTGKILWETGSDNTGCYNARAAVVGDYVLFGSDADIKSGKSSVSCINYKTFTGKEEYSVLSGIEGNIRSGITPVKKDGSDWDIFFTSQSGRLYRAELDCTDGSFDENDTVYCSLYASSTSAPALSDGIIAVGASDKCIHFIDINSMKEVEKSEIPGYPQGELLLSRDGERLYVYSTYNSTPGGIYLTVLDTSSGEERVVSKGDLFVPDKDMQNYCISPLICDADGVIYYKNDSGYVMAVKPGYTVKASASEGGSKPLSMTALYGESLTFVPKADKGYMTADVKADGKSCGGVKSYTFTDIDDNHSIHFVYLAKKTGGFTSAKRASKSSILLKWKKTDGATGYGIYMIKGGKYVKCGSVSSKKTSFTVKNVKKKSGKYKFVLRGYYKNTKKKITCSKYSSVKAVK